MSIVEREGLHLALGHETLNSYAFAATGWESTKTSRMVTLVRRLANLPDMQRAFFAGELPWTNACVGAEAASADPTTDALWTQRVREMSRDELLATYHAETGAPVKRRVVIEVTDEDWAWIEDGLAALRREKGKAVDLGAAVVEVFRRLVLGGGQVLKAGPRPLVTLGVCTECKRVTHGAATVTDPATLALVQQAAVVSVSRTPEVAKGDAPNSTIPRAIPRPTRRDVDGRDGCRCRVPGCKNRVWIDHHHEGGWRNVGHDLESILSLCAKHHAARHRGLLNIVVDSGEAIFSLADGEILGEVDLRALPPPGGDQRVARVAPVAAVAPAQPTAADDARKALVKLGLGVRETEVVLGAVLAATPGATTEQLVLGALRRMPVPA